MFMVNGKHYPLWSQFVEGKDRWIGGLLQDDGDVVDRALFGEESGTTRITDITLKPNGSESAFFTIHGEKFNCGFDVKVGGISTVQSRGEPWLEFSGYAGHRFRIKEANSL